MRGSLEIKLKATKEGVESCNLLIELFNNKKGSN